MAIVFSNNARTTLASNISNSATTITVADGSVFPSLTGGDIFYCTIDDGTNNEIVEVTAISGNTLTVVRAQDNTSANAFVTGDLVELRLVAKVLETFPQLDVGELTADEFIGDLRGAVIFKAKAGEAVSKGDAVYVSGISGNTPVIALADADFTSKMPAFGLVLTAASANGSTEVVTFGTISGVDTSAFSIGDTLYISTTAGELTNSKPTGEASLIQNIGKVQRSHASAGSIKVGGAGRTNDVPNLNDGNIFIGNASNQATTASLNTKIEDYLDANGTTFPDNVKAQFGASNDLQIYHDGSTNQSIISESGAGSLIIKGTNLFLQSADGGYLFRGNQGGAATMYYDNAPKAATTSTGIDVTGRVTSDGLTVVGESIFGTATGVFPDEAVLVRGNNGTSGYINGLGVGSSNSQFRIFADNTNNTAGSIKFDIRNRDRILIEDNGDISFYEDTGTTAKFFWDASAESLGIGTNLPSQPLHVDASGGGVVRVTRLGNSASAYGQLEHDGTNTTLTSSAQLIFNSGGSPVARLDSSGNLLVGTTSESTWESAKGFRARQSGSTTITRDGNPPLYVNRLTSDGDIAVFKKGTTTVGSIGVKGTDLYIGTGDVGLAFYDYSTENAILPHNPATNAFADASIDLGRGTSGSAYRFKDLHLSGTANVGALTSSGDLAIDTNTLFVDVSTDRVGIGEDSVDMKLHISDSTTPGIKFERPGIASYRAGLSGTSFIFSRTSDTLASPVLTLDSSDNATFAGTISSGAITVTTGAVPLSFIESGYTGNGQYWRMPLDGGNLRFDVSLTGGASFTTYDNILQLNSDGTIDIQSAQMFDSSGNINTTKTISSGDVTTTGINIGTDSGDPFNGQSFIRIQDSGNAYIQMKAGASSAGGVLIGDVNDDYVGGMIYYNSINALAFNSGNVTALTLDSSQNATFAGTIDSGAITSTGEIEATALDINGNGDISGNLTLGGYLAGPATFTIDPAAVGYNTGTVVIAGNLQVDGTTTTINSTTLTVDDKNITLASGSINAAAANGAGLTVDCGSGTDATFIYDGTNDEWDFNKDINVTGTVKSDGLTVDTGTNAIINGSSGEGLQFQRGGISQVRIDSVNNDGGVYHAPAGKNHTFKTDGVNRVKFATGGDISFYEDTGTTAKFLWDASDERLNLTGSDYQFGIKQGSNQPWYNRAVSDGSYRIHLNGTGDILTANSAGINVTGTISSGSITAGNSSTAATLRAHYSDGSYMTLQGYGLEMNRSSSYIRPTTDGDKILYIGAADNSLDWNSIYFRSNNGLFLNGTQFISSGLNLTNIGTISTGNSSHITASNGSFSIGKGQSNYVEFLSTTGSGQPRIRPSASGTVDIGDTSRKFKDLHLSGTISSGAITSTGDINLTSTTSTSPAITFNTSSGTDTTIDMAIRATGEGLDFYEPEDGDKVHMRIVDDSGVNAVFGLRTGSGDGTLRLDASGNLSNIGTISSGLVTSSLANSALGFNQAFKINTNPSDYTAGRGGGIVMQNADVITAGIFGIRETSSFKGALAFYTHNNASGNSFGTTFTEKMRITNAGDIQMGASPVTVIDSSKVLQNVTLKIGTTGARFQGNGWHYDTNNDARFYFESSNRTFYRADGGHHFRANGDTTRLTISQSGGINLFSGGDTQAGTGEVINVSGTNILDSSRNLTNIGTISSGAITSTVVNTGDATLLTLHHDTGADISQQKSFIDFSFEDDNTNETPQVRIGAEVGQNADANSQTLEGSGAFVVYTNNADTTAGAAGSSLAERLRVDYQGHLGLGINNPAIRLHTYHPTTNVVARFESGDGQVYIDLQDSNSGTYGALLGHSSTKLFHVADAAVDDKLVLDNSGNLTLNGNYLRLYDSGTQAFGLFKEKTILGTGTSNDLCLFAESITDGGEIHFMTGGSGTKRLTINAAGNATFSGDVTAAGNMYINTANDGLYFSGGNNRIYFNSNRALEGATDGSSLQVGEGYTNILAQGNLTVSGYGVFWNAGIDPDSFSSYAGGIGNIQDGSGWGARGLFVHGGGTGDAAAIAHNGSNLYFGIQNGSSNNSMSTWMQVSPAKAVSMTGAASVALPTTNCSGNFTMSAGHIYLSNFNIFDVNSLSFNDPGPDEGLSWSGGNIKLYESPDDLTTNTAGNLQVVYGSTRRLTVNSTGIDVNGNITAPGGTVDVEALKANDSGTTPGSCKLHVGTLNSAGSSAVAQFGGFIRAADHLIVHGGAGSANAVFMSYTEGDADFRTGEGSGASPSVRVNALKINTSTVITSAAAVQNITSVSMTGNLYMNKSQPWIIISNTTEDGGGVVFTDNQADSAGTGGPGSSSQAFRMTYNCGNETLIMGHDDDSYAGFNFGKGGALTCSGNVTAYSDERLKENIETLDGKKALQMRGVSFTKDGKEGSGVVAQELEKVAPELVTTDKVDGIKSVAYGNLVGYLIEAIKDQQKEIEYMKSEIKNLKENNNGN